MINVLLASCASGDWAAAVLYVGLAFAAAAAYAAHRFTMDKEPEAPWDLLERLRIERDLKESEPGTGPRGEEE